MGKPILSIRLLSFQILMIFKPFLDKGPWIYLFAMEY